MSQALQCVVYERGAPKHVSDLASISDELKRPETFVWFDVVDPEPRDLALLQEEFSLHPLAIEDAVKAHQRSKIETYDDYWFLVVHGTTRENDEVVIHEMAVFAGKNFVITVRDVPPYPLDEIQHRWDHLGGGLGCDAGGLLYTILDTLVDGYWPAAEHYEERINETEQMLFENSGARTRNALLDIFAVKKELLAFRRAVLPMREIVSTIMRNDLDILKPEVIPYFRDVYDHATRLIEEMDSARDLVNSTLDIQLGLTSNQQNEVAKQLTIIATIFLPLTYLTGFFGQNFGWLVNHIVDAKTFWLLGVGSELLALAILMVYFRRKRWI